MVWNRGFADSKYRIDPVLLFDFFGRTEVLLGDLPSLGVKTVQMGYPREPDDHRP
jgi:hypothetical protein